MHWPLLSLRVLLMGCIGLSVAQSATASTLAWQTSLEEAKRIAAETNRLVLVHFWSPSCGPCVELEKNVFAMPQVQQAIAARFVPIKLNADDYPTTARQFGITRLPSDLVITPGGQILGRMISPPTPDVYLQQLAVAAGGSGPVAAPPTVAAPPPAVAGSTSRYGAIAQVPAGHAPPATSAPQSTVAPAAVPAYSGDRYGEFFQRFGGAPATTPAPAAAARPTAPPAIAPAQASPAATQAPAPQASLSAPPLGLDGYSPVTLLEQRRWQIGDRRWGAIHRGRTYLFASPEEQSRFLASPDRYSPVISGRDVALAINYGQDVEGQRQFGMEYAGRVYLFSSEASRAMFNQNPTRYASEVLQAESAHGTLR